MNNHRPIGIFDSGVGGLTVLKAIEQILPFEKLLYLGDTAQAPYGPRSPEKITQLSIQNTLFLQKFKIKLLVVACNTASAFALQTLKLRFKSFPVVDVISPGSKFALAKTQNFRIGIIGTIGTISSQAYPRTLHQLSNKIKIFQKSCPLFVPLVEEGWLNHPVTRLVAKDYIRGLKKTKIDTLIMGCTHYPLLKQAIRGVLGSKVHLVDSASATAQEIKSILRQLNLLSSETRKMSADYFVTDHPDRFIRVGSIFLGKKIKHVDKIRL